MHEFANSPCISNDSLTYFHFYMYGANGGKGDINNTFNNKDTFFKNIIKSLFSN